MSIDVLKTIYDEVEEVAPGRFTLKLNNKFGLVDKNINILVDTTYSMAVIRDKYAAFFSSDKECNKIVFFDTLEEVKLQKSIALKAFDDVMLEHMSLDYKIVEAKMLDDADGVITTLNGLTGKQLFKRKLKGEYSFRPYNNDIIIGFEDPYTQELKAFTADMEVKPIEEALKSYYDKVERLKGKAIKYKCERDGKEYTLNKFGQLY